MRFTNLFAESKTRTQHLRIPSDARWRIDKLNNCHEWQIWKYRLFAPLEWDTVAVMDDKIYLRHVDRAIQLMAQEYIDPF